MVEPAKDLQPHASGAKWSDDTVTGPVPNKAELSPAIRAGLEFLMESQLPWGQFPVERTRRNLPGWPVEEDHSPFATAYILHALASIPHPAVAPMTARGVDYFLREMDGHGLWRYWNKGSVQSGRKAHPFIPADLDDMACISAILRREGIPFPDNRRLMLHNRDRHGHFYTYQILRAIPTLDPIYWWAMLRDFTWQRWFVYWRSQYTTYDDVSGVVNANVIWYLGNHPKTQKAIDWLIGIVEAGGESDCDTYYHDPFPLWHAIARGYAAGVTRFASIRDTVRSRIETYLLPDGSIAAPEMHTALAMSALLNFGVESPFLAAGRLWLEGKQAVDGGWDTCPMYFGARLRQNSWGSRALTTALCLEAMQRQADAERRTGMAG